MREKGNERGMRGMRGMRAREKKEKEEMRGRKKGDGR
jgi:hypothetical protein